MRVNKTDLIDRIAELLNGDRMSAQTAVEGFIDVVQHEVQCARTVTISGFGVWEQKTRAARTARNPRTGEEVKVEQTVIPVFRPAPFFKDVVARGGDDAPDKWASRRGKPPWVE